MPSRVLQIHSKTERMSATHIWVYTAFSLVPQNDFIFKCCLIHLKNNSTCHRALYMSAISCAVNVKLLVMNSSD